MPHLPSYTWSYRVPSPPRVIVPPPALDGSGLPELPIGQDVSFDFESNGFNNSEFLKTVTYDDFTVTNNLLNWKYEERRMAQPVLPFLYLGPLSAAKDAAFLRREGITMVMAVRNTTSAHARLLGSKAATELGIDTRTIDVAGNQELIAAFPRVIEAINLHLSTMYQQQQQSQSSLASLSNQQSHAPTPGKVLIFCESGNERSAGVVAAYIMAMYSLDLISSIQIVQSQRFCVSFDDSLKTLLQSYEVILRAKRDVAKAEFERQAARLRVPSSPKEIGGKNGSLNGMASKRTLNEAYDADMDLDGGYDQMDNERFEGRDGYAPFEDRVE
ncbi:MAG: hypothetical protein Q9187_001309 [Circinaria calcarea]